MMTEYPQLIASSSTVRLRRIKCSAATFLSWTSFLPSKNLPIEAWPGKPRKWLQHGLLDQITNYIACAKNDKWALDIANYEYELKAIIDAVNAAHARGVQGRVLYHAKVGDAQTK